MPLKSTSSGAWCAIQVGVGRHVPPQRAAERDIDLLEAPADAEHRLAQVQHGLDQVGGHAVAGRVERPARRRLLAIEGRIEVRGATRQHQTIQAFSDLGRAHPPRQRRDQQRGHIAIGHGRVDIAAHHCLGRLDPDRAGATDDPGDRARGHPRPPISITDCP